MDTKEEVVDDICLKRREQLQHTIYKTMGRKKVLTKLSRNGEYCNIGEKI